MRASLVQKFGSDPELQELAEGLRKTAGKKSIIQRAEADGDSYKRIGRRKWLSNAQLIYFGTFDSPFYLVEASLEAVRTQQSTKTTT